MLDSIEKIFADVVEYLSIVDKNEYLSIDDVFIKLYGMTYIEIQIVLNTIFKSYFADELNKRLLELHLNCNFEGEQYEWIRRPFQLQEVQKKLRLKKITKFTLYSFPCEYIARKLKTDDDFQYLSIERDGSLLFRSCCFECLSENGTFETRKANKTLDKDSVDCIFTGIDTLIRNKNYGYDCTDSNEFRLVVYYDDKTFEYVLAEYLKDESYELNKYIRSIVDIDDIWLFEDRSVSTIRNHSKYQSLILASIDEYIEDYLLDSKKKNREKRNRAVSEYKTTDLLSYITGQYVVENGIYNYQRYVLTEKELVQLHEYAIRVLEKNGYYIDEKRYRNDVTVPVFERRFEVRRL